MKDQYKSLPSHSTYFSFIGFSSSSELLLHSLSCRFCVNILCSLELPDKITEMCTHTHTHTHTHTGQARARQTRLGSFPLWLHHDSCLSLPNILKTSG